MAVDDLGGHTLLQDLVCMAAAKWCGGERAAKQMSNKKLAKYVTEKYS